MDYRRDLIQIFHVSICYAKIVYALYCYSIDDISARNRIYTLWFLKLIENIHF